MPILPYRDDLAHIHDAGFGHVAAAAAEALLKLLGPARGLVVDLGCGGGILSEKLAAAGFDVLGLDLSPAMVELARRRVPSGTFRVAPALDAAIPPCVAVAAVGEVLNYQFDPRADEPAIRDLFRRVRASLAPGGAFLFDLAGPGRVPAPGVQKSFAEGEGWAVLVAAEEDPGTRTLTRRITSFRDSGGGLYRRDEETHTLRLHPPADALAWLRDAGFANARALDSYADLRLPPGWAAFLARQPPAAGRRV